MATAGKRVLSLESRRAVEAAELIRRNGGHPFVAPSLREVPVEQNDPAFQFADQLFDGRLDAVIFLTGVGTRYLTKLIDTRYGPGRFAEALRAVTIVARGPKPIAVLREMNVPVHLSAPEPNTWREVLAVTDAWPAGFRVAIQLYGELSNELIDAYRARGIEVTPVPVYQWQLPEDTAPLREAAAKVAASHFDVVLFTSSQQLVHLLHVAREMGIETEVLQALGRTRIASIGPTTSDTLRKYGLEPAIEASHPKLGLLVKEAVSD